MQETISQPSSTIMLAALEATADSEARLDFFDALRTAMIGATNERRAEFCEIICSTPSCFLPFRQELFGRLAEAVRDNLIPLDRAAAKAEEIIPTIMPPLLHDAAALLIDLIKIKPDQADRIAALMEKANFSNIQSANAFADNGTLLGEYSAFLTSLCAIRPDALSPALVLKLAKYRNQNKQGIASGKGRTSTLKEAEEKIPGVLETITSTRQDLWLYAYPEQRLADLAQALRGAAAETVTIPQANSGDGKPAAPVTATATPAYAPEPVGTGYPPRGGFGRIADSQLGRWVLKLFV